jgi:hypothetical protein
VDLLVVATSEQRHGEQIFNTNERRIDGQEVFHSKRSVRNLVGNSNDMTGKKLGVSLERVMKRLNGYVEYDAPHASIKINGIFKLDNDPKMNVFTSKNVLFAGTKLCSS